MNAQRGRVTQSGRVSLPADMRRAMGLDHGGDVIFELEGHEIRIRTVEEVVRRSQELTKRLIGGKPASDVDSFLAERRREAKREP